MSHIHYALDWTAGAFIVYNKRVLLIWHYKLKCWLCPGGHLELGEDPIQGLRREIREEVGLEIDIIGHTEPINDERSQSLIVPRFLDKHPITETHQHIGCFYLARPMDKVPIIGGEYTEGRCGWFSEEELVGLDMWPATRYYASTAIKELS